MRILVVGGTRFIGAGVVRQLHREGHDLTVLHRGRTPGAALPAVNHILDEHAEYPIVRFPAAAEKDWDAVIHMVAMGAADAAAFRAAFAGRAARLVMVSSCDVYRAYGRLTGLEPGLPEPLPIDEDAPLRTVFYPYRGMEKGLGRYARDYEKILAERALMEGPDAPEWTILRLAKVYGPGDNDDLATVYGFAREMDWAWSHVHVDNAAAAIALAALAPAAACRVFNVCEDRTPSMQERLSILPARAALADRPRFDFRQKLILSSARIRRDLGYRDVVDERQAMTALAERSTVGSKERS